MIKKTAKKSWFWLVEYYLFLSNFTKKCVKCEPSENSPKTDENSPVSDEIINIFWPQIYQHSLMNITFCVRYKKLLAYFKENLSIDYHIFNFLSLITKGNQINHTKPKRHDKISKNL